jgi:hypothetical protein
LGTGQAYAQTCHWNGTSPFCSGACGDNESEKLRSRVGSGGIQNLESTNPFGADCFTGTKVLCCSSPGRSCRWDGTAPFCDGGCRAGEERATPPDGSTSGMPCLTGSKAFCCRTTTLPPVLQPLEPAPPARPPAAPTGCHIPQASTPRCGFVDIECDRPLPVADEIVVGGSARVKVFRIVSELGLINAEYSDEGETTLSVCARGKGGVACGNRFSVSLGPTSCPTPPARPVCQSGFKPCPLKGCIPAGDHCDLPQ